MTIRPKANFNGELGDGTTVHRWTPVRVNGVTGATQVVLGLSHACALLAGGAVYCWGANESGELGDGTTTGRLMPEIGRAHV